jgi:hypothetical protein
LRALAVGLAISVTTVHLASAQAWVGPAGTGSVSFAVQKIDNTGHIGTDEVSLPIGKSTTAAIYVEGEYAFTDRLTISVGLPFVFAKYIGPDSPPGPDRPVDICRCWNGAFQDVSVTARFNLSNGTLGITPFASFGVPSHDYDFRGEAVVGRGLRELRLGVAAGRRLDPFSRRLSVAGSYSYAIVQKVVDVPNNRSNTDVGLAYAATDSLSLKGSLAWQRTHGGLRTIGPPPEPDGYPWGEITNAELFSQHDRLLRDNSLHAAISASYSLRDIDLFGSYVVYAGGSNTHDGRAFTAGVSWPFAWSRPHK